MTTITIPRALLEQALNALTYKGHFPWADKEHFIDALRAELAKPRLDQAETNKRLQALADSEGTRAVEYLRRARKAESEIERLRAELAKPVEQAEQSWNRSIRDSVDVLLAGAGYQPDSSARHQLAMMNFDQKAQSTPAWHDAPDVAALKAELDLARAQLEAEYRINSETLSILERTEQELNALLKHAAIAKAEGGAE